MYPDFFFLFPVKLEVMDLLNWWIDKYFLSGQKKKTFGWVGKEGWGAAKLLAAEDWAGFGGRGVKVTLILAVSATIQKGSNLSASRCVTLNFLLFTFFHDCTVLAPPPQCPSSFSF